MPAPRSFLALGSAIAIATLTACASGGTRANVSGNAGGGAAGASTASTSTAGSNSAAASTAAAPRSPSRNRNLLTMADLDGSGAQNMSEAVQRLRPQWLQLTSTRSMGGSGANLGVSVYVDGQRFGTAAQLRNVSLDMVGEARYYTPSEAQAKFGLRDAGPVIAITTRK